ncbi:alpha/beta hydrolase [Stenomitos frigidus]|uniref:AB hydrolase-1 domain-containing protein n=1 Tax=Stenomitos frigidus ULC18 TaxID=2107698 RepID=A0A2T1EBI1_9CYAN|nr:alpha/beta hydrolase [Stenomitos frigidus]PSB30053.1 hypothetical protein C7B82_09785 [Stenomitos frigidus ULC18]
MQLELISRSPTNHENGNSILFVHGAYHAAWCWEEHFLDYFSNSGYFAYALSLRGHGNSESFALQKVGFNEYLEDIKQTIQKLGQQTILVGHSLGGMLVQKYIETNAVPAAVIMSATTPQGLNAVGKRLLSLYPIKTMQMLLTGNPNTFWHSSQVIQNMFLSPEITEDKKNHYTKRIVSQSEPGHLMLKELPSLKFNRPIKPQRILVLKGKKDALIQDRECNMLADIHQVRPVFLDQLPHDLMLGENWKLAADTTLNWLQAEGLH